MLDKLRKKIDKIDKNISRQLKNRHEIITKIAKLKQKGNLPVYNPEREEKHLNEILSKNKCHKKCNNYIKKIFKEIFRISRSIQ